MQTEPRPRSATDARRGLVERNDTDASRRRRGRRAWCVVGKEIPVRKFFFSLTLAACAAGFASDAAAQYYQQPHYQQPAPQAAAAMPGRYAPAAQAHYAPAQRGYAVQPTSVAMRPGTTTYAAAPVSAGFKPVNPPSAATQRLLLASRSQPTPAPAPAPAAANAAPTAARARPAAATPAAVVASVATACCVRRATWCNTCRTSARRTATTTSARTT